MSRKCALCKGTGRVYVNHLGGVVDVNEKEACRLGSNVMQIVCPACRGRGY